MGRQPSTIRAIAVTVAVVSLLIPGTASARSHTFPQVQIEAEVTTDGSLIVREHRTADFKGSFFGMFQWIPRERGSDIIDINVSEDGKPYTLHPGGDPGPPGTYFVRHERDRTYVDWSFEATDEIRVFTLSYRMANAVVVHDDVAELYYKFIGEEWDTGVGHVTVNLRLPPGAQASEVRAWGHGPLHGNVTIQTGQNIAWEIDRLPPRTFVEGRVTFPVSLVPAATVHTGRPGLDRILDEEQNWAAAANRSRLISLVDLLAAIIIALAGIAAAVWIYLRYGREYRPSFSGDYYRDLPAAYTPAELGVLWRFGSPGPPDLTATIVDLARKGHLRLEEFETEQRALFRRRKRTDYRIVRLDNSDALETHERALLTFLFDRIAGRSTDLTFSAIEQYAQSQRASFATFWQKWRQDLTARGTTLGFFDPATRVARTAEFGLAVILFVGAFALFFFGFRLSGIGMTAAALALAIGAAGLRRRGTTGVEDFVRWRAFRTFLLHFSNMDRHQIPSLIVWEQYLVYAITLGVAKEVIGQLQIVFPELSDGSYRFGHGWYMGPRIGSSLTGITSGVDSLGSSIERSIRTATSQSSSGSGRGGGFSGGGGGGRGGGGGGVR